MAISFALILSFLATWPVRNVTAQCPDLASLNDEFNDASTLGDWQRHYLVDGWANDQANVLDVNQTTLGGLHIEPEVTTWFQDYRAVYLFKLVTGDFSVVIRINTSGLSAAVPTQIFTLAGVMARVPRAVTPATWVANQENWVFITTGTGAGGGTPQFETKDTINSVSNLILTPSQPGWLELRMDRIGSDFFLYRRFPGENWFLERTISRIDMPATLQVGPNAYTNYNDVNNFPGGAFEFNSTLLTSPPENRDMIVRYDYIRFSRPTAGLVDRDGDGDVDGIDFTVFASCFNGAGNAPRTVGCSAADATAYDADCDGDVDGIDFTAFASCFNRSGNPPRTLGCPPH